ncbi:subtilisin-like protein [Punctularia strigosozonata HHB-11173 SS5]|uniref:subtilisin-like protein n=1 Tax=Punctularia strigosozonata (strain HHB-11173) TaxID=741275 RepID=UPI000441791F|nr:subtilisin-like protein [Punctularia strigosozonata HHB-11173 SS5]EIN08407.1 subtilisin-like protein [Punctularia strigosozonata HHB-11173 SS5]
MRAYPALLTLLLSVCVSAVPSRRAPHVVHERRANEPNPERWQRTGRVEPDRVLPLKIGLAQQNLHLLEEMLMKVSHPKSDSYGQHWSPAAVVDFFAPKDETIDAIKGWLADAGFDAERIRVSHNKGWIDVANATAAEVEELLDAEYHVYTHAATGLQQIGCHSYSVPAHIQEHVDLIKPTVHFTHHIPESPSKRKRELKKRFGGIGAPSPETGPKTNGVAVTITPSLETCDQMITPDCLRALYAVNYTPVATDRNTFGITEFTPQAFLASDLDLFFGNFSPSQVGTRPITVAIDGGTVQTTDQSFDFNGESDLDLEYAFALTNPQPITLLQTGDLVEGASFDNWLDAVDASFCTFEGGDDPDFDGIYPDTARGGFKGAESCGIIAPPNVVSTSYGADEADFTVAYANRQCAEYGKLGMLGTTVLYSSGDDGVAGNGGECLTAQGTPSTRGTRFSPDFPVTCPFVTGVGATQVNPGATVNDPESACAQVIFSGGGFSNFFNMPSYQAEAVTSFLTNHPPPFTSAQFNNSGTSRGVPDLSANGANYVIGIDGDFELVFGTSASSPVVGSLITLINDARIAAGKGPVGFINPAIYSGDFQAAFNDITNGTNPGCGMSLTTGWDPVTGVGTPNLTKLMPLFLALP